MTEPKWPDSPWDFEWVSAPASGGGHLYIIDATGRKIAAIWGKADEKKYAAWLIAAAPALYGALKAVVAIADRRTDEFDAARAALAKARGEP